MRRTGEVGNPEWLKEAAQVAEEAARLAGAILLDWQGRFTISEKGRFDLVTEADVAAQDAIRNFVLARFPDHAFLGEEGVAGAQLTDDRPSWGVDPLDGTTNYAHGIPLYCTSIALVVEAVPVVGVILDPCRNELFAGAKGQGAQLNGRPIRVSTVDDLNRALLSVGFPTDPERHAIIMRSWSTSRRARSRCGARAPRP